MGCNLSIAALAINMQKNNADPDIAEYIQSALAEKLSYLNDKQIDVALYPNGDALTISYQISAEGLSGEATSRDVWTDLDYAIQQVVSSIQQKLSSTARQVEPVQRTEIRKEEQSQQSVSFQPTYTKTSPRRESFEERTNTQKDYIGSLKIFTDGSRGIVFYITEDGHGLVVSLDEAEMKWENEKSQYKCHDIALLPNEEEPSKYLTFKLGLKHTNAIIQQLGRYQAPAADWCAQHGNDWYLPSAGELWYLMSEANKGSTANTGTQTAKMRNQIIANGPINRALMNAGGMVIQNESYWSSTEKDKDDVCTVDATGDMSSSEKPDSELVRAIRAF